MIGRKSLFSSKKLEVPESVGVFTDGEKATLTSTNLEFGLPSDSDKLNITGKKLSATKNNVVKEMDWFELLTKAMSPPMSPLNFSDLVGANNKFSKTLGDVTSTINLGQGGFAFEKESTGLKSSGGIFPNGLLYTNESEDVVTTTLAVNLNTVGDLVLETANRTVFGSKERDTVTADFEVPEKTNLSYSMFIEADEAVTITLPLYPQLGQRIRLYSNGNANFVVMPPPTLSLLSEGPDPIPPEPLPLTPNTLTMMDWTGTAWVGSESKTTPTLQMHALA